MKNRIVRLFRIIGLFLATFSSIISCTIEEIQLNIDKIENNVTDVGDESDDENGDGLEILDTPVVRINAAGAAISSSDGTKDWEANNTVGAQTELSFTVNTGKNYNDNITPTRHSSIPDYIDDKTYNEIFDQERYDDDSAPEMKYSIPLEEGNYVVNIYTSNVYYKYPNIGDRIFDILIEEDLAFDDFDIIEEFGHQVGGMISYRTTVTDGNLDIEFIHGVQNPIVNAIEILGVNTGSDPFNDDGFYDLTQYGYINLKIEGKRPSDDAPFTHESVLQFIGNNPEKNSFEFNSCDNGCGDNHFDIESFYGFSFSRFLNPPNSDKANSLHIYFEAIDIINREKLDFGLFIKFNDFLVVFDDLTYRNFNGEYDSPHDPFDNGVVGKVTNYTFDRTTNNLKFSFSMFVDGNLRDSNDLNISGTVDVILFEKVNDSQGKPNKH